LDLAENASEAYNISNDPNATADQKSNSKHKAIGGAIGTVLGGALGMTPWGAAVGGPLVTGALGEQIGSYVGENTNAIVASVSAVGTSMLGGITSAADYVETGFSSVAHDIKDGFSGAASTVAEEAGRVVGQASDAAVVAISAGAPILLGTGIYDALHETDFGKDLSSGLYSNIVTPLQKTFKFKKFGEIAVDLTTKFAAGAASIAGSVSDWVKHVGTNVVDYAKEKVEQVKTAGGQASDFAADRLDRVKRAASEFGSGAKTSGKNLYEDLGLNITQAKKSYTDSGGGLPGFGAGVKSIAGSVGSSVHKAADTVYTGARHAGAALGVPKEIADLAQASQDKYGIPAAVTTAQWQLESTGGKSMPRGSNSPFGVKATKDQIANGQFVEATTTEHENGVDVKKSQKFAKYDSLSEAFDKHAALLAHGGAYKDARTKTDDPYAFADALTGHYATDPKYGSKLKDIMTKQAFQKGDEITEANVSATSQQIAGSTLMPKIGDETLADMASKSGTYTVSGSTLANANITPKGTTFGETLAAMPVKQEEIVPGAKKASYSEPAQAEQAQLPSIIQANTLYKGNVPDLDASQRNTDTATVASAPVNTATSSEHRTNIQTGSVLYGGSTSNVSSQQYSQNRTNTDNDVTTLGGILQGNPISTATDSFGRSANALTNLPKSIMNNGIFDANMQGAIGGAINSPRNLISGITQQIPSEIGAIRAIPNNIVGSVLSTPRNIASSARDIANVASSPGGAITALSAGAGLSGVVGRMFGSDANASPIYNHTQQQSNVNVSTGYNNGGDNRGEAGSNKHYSTGSSNSPSVSRSFDYGGENARITEAMPTPFAGERSQYIPPSTEPPEIIMPQAAPMPQAQPTQQQGSSGSSGNGGGYGSTVGQTYRPSIDDIPININDSGLMLLNIGYL
jgi:Mannosyl-glycoprotein endo-beta-N-acetylglucosaminidase